MWIKLCGVRVHITFLFAVFLALVLRTGGARHIGAAFFSALLHECAHLLLLRSYGCAGLTLTLLPGGAAIGGAWKERLSYQQALVCALAGPAVNLLLAAALFLCAKRFVNAALRQAAFVNLALGGFNLLPLSFLDGGRALRYLAAVKSKSPVPFAGAERLDLIVIVFLAVLTAVLFAVGRTPGYLPVFTGYCLLVKLRRPRSLRFPPEAAGPRCR